MVKQNKEISWPKTFRTRPKAILGPIAVSTIWVVFGLFAVGVFVYLDHGMASLDASSEPNKIFLNSTQIVFVLVIGPAIIAAFLNSLRAFRSIEVSSDGIATKFGPFTVRYRKWSEVVRWNVGAGPDFGKSILQRNPFVLPRLHRTVLVNAKWGTTEEVFDCDVSQPGYQEFQDELRKHLRSQPEPESPPVVDSKPVVAKPIENLDQRSWRLSGWFIFFNSILLWVLAALFPPGLGLSISVISGALFGLCVGLLWSRTRRQAVKQGLITGVVMALAGGTFFRLSGEFVEWFENRNTALTLASWPILLGLYFVVGMGLVRILLHSAIILSRHKTSDNRATSRVKQEQA